MQKFYSALWKLFAALLCVMAPFSLVFWTSVDGEAGFLNVIGAILTIPGAIGVACYAFDKTMLSAGFWPPFAKVLGLWAALWVVISAWDTTVLAVNAAHWSEVVVLLCIMPFHFIIPYFMWIGVQRYAQRRTAKSAAAA